MNAIKGYGESFSVDIVAGGFIITYPVLDEDGECSQTIRQVITSPRKLQQKIKEIIDNIGLTSDN